MHVVTSGQFYVTKLSCGTLRLPGTQVPTGGFAASVSSHQVNCLLNSYGAQLRSFLLGC